MKISRFFFTRDYASTVDRKCCHSSRRNDFQFGEFCLKSFATCVVIEKNTACMVCRPRKTPYSSGHSGPTCLSMGRLAFAVRLTVIRPNPFIGYQSQRGRGLSRDTPLLYFLSGFFVQCPIMLQMKGVERKLPSRRRQTSLARADTVRHKSGIVIAWFDNVRLRRVAKIKREQSQRTTVRKSLRMPIVLGSALKSSRKKTPDFDY